MMLNGLWREHWTVAVVNHLWQSTVVMLVAWLLTMVLRRNRASTRYWIWMTASLKLLVPFSLLAALGNQLRPASAPAARTPQFPGVMVNMAHPFLSGFQDAQPLAAAPPLTTAVASSSHHIDTAQALAMLWLCGSLYLLLRWSRDWLALRRMLRSASPVSLPIHVPVFVTSHMIEPGIVGLLRPVLLLPRQILDRLSHAQMRSILAHESCHVFRRDNLTAAIHMAVEAIFWFHPAVWWIERRLIEERERACDEAVLQLGNEAEVYAESILNVCKCYTESPLPCMSGVTGSELKQRILRIMNRQVALELDLGRKLLLSAVTIVAVSLPVLVGVLHATDVRAQSRPADSPNSIAATWQGTLHTDRSMRFVVKITQQEDRTLRAVFYNLDGPPGGIPVISTTRSDSALKLDLAFATYEGTVSPNGRTITGKWTQGSTASPLILERATQDTAWTIPEPPPRLPAMAADADTSFEVATIKPSRPDERGPRYFFDHRRFSVTHVTLNQLVQFSYSLQEREIVGTPAWFNAETYNISARPGGEGEPSIKQWQAMVKKLMADRFQLRFHNEKRPLAVYVLTVGNNGPKLTRSQGDPNGQPGLGFGPPGNMGTTNATMAEVAEALQQGALDRPVVDHTGLTGRFDLRLRWMPDQMGSATENPEALPDLFTAIQEQLGLRLVSTRAQVDVLAIDRVERPSPN